MKLNLLFVAVLGVAIVLISGCAATTTGSNDNDATTPMGGAGGYFHAY